MSLGFLGACAFGPVLVGATLEITTGSEGTRTGNFDPPPFNAVDPESVDAGLIADAFELSADAGVVVSDVNAQ